MDGFLNRDCFWYKILPGVLGNVVYYSTHRIQLSKTVQILEPSTYSEVCRKRGWQGSVLEEMQTSFLVRKFIFLICQVIFTKNFEEPILHKYYCVITWKGDHVH